MFGRIAIASFLIFGAVVTANLVSVPQASAELYFDYATRTWVKEDPAARMRHRRPPARKYNRRNVSIATRETPGTIIIDTDRKFLYYMTGRNKATRYGIGVGREGFGWDGRVAVKRKQEWPSWTPPAEMRAREKAKGIILPARMEGGPKNPLGARALYLYKGNNDTLYRIHGTNQPWTIGLNMSSGCIRMMNEDVKHLYDRTNIGTKVVVIGPGRDSSRIYSPSNPFRTPLTFLFGG
jgi:lipoprotein-anchoring transpeptidase ErfK/SrfK